ncbi:hypothetical protein SynSYN20_00787 [Synechococcus sp. SYN20]|nr:hypothetical protein SynSYN20_00787 [Synechococcus sp. SYN20]
MAQRGNAKHKNRYHHHFNNLKDLQQNFTDRSSQMPLGHNQNLKNIKPKRHN